MNYRDSDKKRFRRALEWERTDRTPNLETLFESKHVDAILGRQLGKNSWAIDPADQVELALRTGIDMLFVGGYGKFGQRYEVMEDGSSQYTDGMIKSAQVFGGWDFPAEFRRKLEQFEYALRLLTDAVRNTPIGAAVAFRSVFADTTLSMGLGDFMLNLYDDPDFVRNMMDLYLDFALQIVGIISRYPVDLVLIDDDLSDSKGLMIGEERTRELWYPRTRVLTDKLKSLGVPYIGHCCGNLDQVIPMLVELGFLAVHPVQPSCNDIYALQQKYRKRIAFIGNIDILETLSLGTEEEVKKEVAEHVLRLGGDGGYVLSSSHTMVNSIPVANYEVMLRTLHELERGRTPAAGR